MISRRSLLGGIGAFIVAPAIATPKGFRSSIVEAPRVWHTGGPVSSAYDDYTRLMVRRIAMGLGVSYEEVARVGVSYEEFATKYQRHRTLHSAWMAPQKSPYQMDTVRDDELCVVLSPGSAIGKTEQLTQQILDAGRIERPFIPSRPFTRKST